MVDIAKYAKDPWGLRAALLKESTSAIGEASAAYIRHGYSELDLLTTARRFANYVIIDAAPGDWQSLERVWFFPWAESSAELDRSLSLATLGQYRAAYDHQRRGFELIAIGVYFVSEHTTVEHARAWMQSTDPTPRFAKALACLAQHSAAVRLSALVDWRDRIEKHYWKLCDIAHVRGLAAGSYSVQPTHLSFDGIDVPEFSEESLRASLDSYISTVRLACLFFSLSNPSLLFDYGIADKFGLNGPLSGFLEPYQVEVLRKLLPDDIRDPLLQIADTEPLVEGFREYFSSLPEITEEELEQQIRDFRAQFDSPDV